MPVLATRVEPKSANLWRWHLRPKRNEEVPQCPFNSVAIHGPLTLPGDTCSCHVGTLRLDVGTSVDPHPGSRAHRPTENYDGILDLLTRTRGPSRGHTPTHVSSLCVCVRVCVCVCVCAWSAHTHRERSQPLPSSPGGEIWRPEVLGSNWFWRFLPLLPREAFSVSSSA